MAEDLAARLPATTLALFTLAPPIARMTRAVMLQALSSDFTRTARARRRGDTTLGHILYVLREIPVTMLAFAMLAFFLGCAFFGPALVPCDPLPTNASRAPEPPS